MVTGAVGAGKSTLLHTLFENGPVTKTQSLEYTHNAIDTPGEFTAHPFLKSALFATALEADLVIFIKTLLLVIDNSHQDLLRGSRSLLSAW